MYIPTSVETPLYIEGVSVGPDLPTLMIQIKKGGVQMKNVLVGLICPSTGVVYTTAWVRPDSLMATLARNITCENYIMLIDNMVYALQVC